MSGEHTDTGAPILANDPHLATTAPGPLRQVGLHCRSLSAACPYDVAGFTFSGVPGVVIGHNADIAWGLTNLGADVTDLYVERVTGDTWRRGAKQRPLEVRKETIEVEDGDDVTIEVRSTAHGPIVSDADDVLARGRRRGAGGSAGRRSGGGGVRRLPVVDRAVAVADGRRDPPARPGP